MPLTSNESEFRDVVAKGIANFADAQVVRRLVDGALTLADYQTVLLTLFHQSYDGPYNMALAASRCSWRHEAAKEYLIVHAAEESPHWRWILDDLSKTAYAGPSPRELFPHPTCQAYVSFTEHISEKAPYTRLATASVLEGIAAEFGEKYGRLLLQRLQLGKEQATFFLRHAETDKKHSKEIADTISRCGFNAQEWGWMTYVAKIAGSFYMEMYNHDGYYGQGTVRRSA